MKKIMNPTIEIAPDFLLRQFGWAMRYCANRSSYAVEDCIDMALFIHANRDKFNPIRVKFLARDLRNEANNRLGFKKNVEVTSSDNSYDCETAYYMIAAKLAQCPTMRFSDYKWEVDVGIPEVLMSHREPFTELYGGLAKLYDCDIETVCIAADIIHPDKHYRVTTFHKDHEESNECIKSFMAEQIYDEQKHTTIDYKYSAVYRPINNPNSWLASNYITKIERI